MVVNIKVDHYDILIDRRTILGNPFILGKDGDRDCVIDKFEIYARDRIKTDPIFKKCIKRCYGKILGCHCKPLRCHGDIIEKLAKELNE